VAIDQADSAAARHIPEHVFDILGMPEKIRNRKIKFGGSLGGRTPLTSARRSQWPLLRASVLPAQRLYDRLRDILLVYGKEKVYGSIP
jgi:hypothetical protein